MERLVKVDGKVGTDHNYPAGFIDVTFENFSGLSMMVFTVLQLLISKK